MEVAVPLSTSNAAPCWPLPGQGMQAAVNFVFLPFYPLEVCNSTSLPQIFQLTHKMLAPPARSCCKDLLAWVKASSCM